MTLTFWSVNHSQIGCKSVAGDIWETIDRVRGRLRALSKSQSFASLATEMQYALHQ